MNGERAQDKWNVSIQDYSIAKHAERYRMAEIAEFK